jgi:trk system potassium uptake protein TrkH
MAALGLDMISAIGSVAASIGNVGPGFGIVGPVKNYLQVPVMGKWVLIFCMLLGRLEIYTVIALLTPEFWRK